MIEARNDRMIEEQCAVGWLEMKDSDTSRTGARG